MTNKEIIKILDDVRAETFYRYPAMNEALKLAISALEKQIPKKPIEEKPAYEKYRCPICGKCVGYGIIDVDNKNKIITSYYCPVCGQALDWSDEE